MTKNYFLCQIINLQRVQSVQIFYIITNDSRLVGSSFVSGTSYEFDIGSDDNLPWSVTLYNSNFDTITGTDVIKDNSNGTAWDVGTNFPVECCFGCFFVCLLEEK